MVKEKGLLLLSGGIDSPVAGWLMKRLGLELYGVHFYFQADEKKITKLAKTIGLKKLFLVPHQKNLKEFSVKCNNRYLCIFCKRIMYRLAERLAKEHKIKYLITGENLAQVASQTLQNMQLLDSAVSIPVFRPLLTYDKQEIINIARKIKTFDISIDKQERCAFVPNNPATRGKKEIIEEEERKLNVTKLIDLSIRNIRQITL